MEIEPLETYINKMDILMQYLQFKSNKNHMEIRIIEAYQELKESIGE